ncbi:hypothetical protein Ahy_B03g066566 [Arachis hypogaea]|uniref:Aminotransferase-like plant mobile domain-containing protein n=1 Tax=Arachis hypogaea TaxID=3818 RepID=A0A445A4C1_ARAHY|nr:hypothetical protein Ahy_B03g066566 [Arachis hypogaea]
MYDCGLFQSLHFPRHHALIGCAAASVEWGLYVHPVYLRQAVFKVYEVKFPSILDEKLWSKWYRTRLCPNPAMRRKSTGKPISTKFHNEMDEGERQKNGVVSAGKSVIPKKVI